MLPYAESQISFLKYFGTVCSFFTIYSFHCYLKFGYLHSQFFLHVYFWASVPMMTSCSKSTLCWLCYPDLATSPTDSDWSISPFIFAVVPLILRSQQLFHYTWLALLSQNFHNTPSWMWLYSFIYYLFSLSILHLSCLEHSRSAICLSVFETQVKPKYFPTINLPLGKWMGLEKHSLRCLSSKFHSHSSIWVLDNLHISSSDSVFRSVSGSLTLSVFPRI